MSDSLGTLQEWSIRYDHYDTTDENRREALFALGNGYVVSRAAAPESAENSIHYPGTYRVGCYNRLSTPVEGREVENESLVNLPNWLSMSFRVGDGPWFSLDEVEILSYRQELHLDVALLERQVRFRTRRGRICRLHEKRFVSMAQKHLMLLRQEITAENWSGGLEIRSGIDGAVQNNNVDRYAPFRKNHLKTLSADRIGQECLELISQTVQSAITLTLMARTRLWQHGQAVSCPRSVHPHPDGISECLQTQLTEGESLTVEKTAVLFTSQDRAISDCHAAAREALAEAVDFEMLFEEHKTAWQNLWKRCKLDVGPQDQLLFFRLHVFQILQNISPHTADMDVGVPPSGWQGEEYHGQIFWDEMFIFPFLAYRFPTIARSLLLYRYRRLDAARKLAREAGYRGAMYPWRSASSGQEETPLLQYNLYSGHWMEDYTYLQRHIGAIIAYSISNYVEVTGDKLFWAEYGAEMLFEIARFWASLAQYNAELDRYEIKGVVGPDEHHTHYPDADPGNPEGRGIDNNSYTNVMAAWTLLRAGQMYHLLTQQQQEDLRKAINLGTDELAQWEEISCRMRLILLEDGTLDQFESYNQLKDFDQDAFRKKWGDQRVDWRLEAEGDDINRYRLSKQADTSLLLYLFAPAELQRILEHMGYSLSREQMKKTIDYQIAHNANGSSLSRIIHAGALAHFDLSASWDLFQIAQQIDVSPTRHDDSAEGIHLGAMGGSLGVLQHHYLGMEVQEDTLAFAPALPDALGDVCLGVQFRGVELICRVSGGHLLLQSPDPQAEVLKISFAQKTHALRGGDSLRIRISDTAN